MCFTLWLRNRSHEWHCLRWVCDHNQLCSPHAFHLVSRTQLTTRTSTQKGGSLRILTLDHTPLKSVVNAAKERYETDWRRVSAPPDHSWFRALRMLWWQWIRTSTPQRCLRVTWIFLNIFKLKFTLNVMCMVYFLGHFDFLPPSAL